MDDRGEWGNSWAESSEVHEDEQEVVWQRGLGFLTTTDGDGH